MLSYPNDSPEFVEVHIDDILIFSRIMKEHIDHLRQVLERLRGARLRLKPVKCHFLQQSIEYLGHVITPDGLKPNSNRAPLSLSKT